MPSAAFVDLAADEDVAGLLAEGAGFAVVFICFGLFGHAEQNVQVLSGACDVTTAGGCHASLHESADTCVCREPDMVHSATEPGQLRDTSTTSTCKYPIPYFQPLGQHYRQYH